MREAPLWMTEASLIAAPGQLRSTLGGAWTAPELVIVVAGLCVLFLAIVSPSAATTAAAEPQAAAATAEFGGEEAQEDAAVPEDREVPVVRAIAADSARP